MVKDIETDNYYEWGSYNSVRTHMMMRMVPPESGSVLGHAYLDVSTSIYNTQ